MFFFYHDMGFPDYKTKFFVKKEYNIIPCFLTVFSYESSSFRRLYVIKKNSVNRLILQKLNLLQYLNLSVLK